MSDRLESKIQRQTAFGEDGQLEVTETSIETSLEDFGADIDHCNRDSRLDRPEASGFGVDDRPEVARSSEDDQSTLFADIAEDQQTLDGDDASKRCRLTTSPGGLSELSPLPKASSELGWYSLFYAISSVRNLSNYLRYGS
nr:hypothetical protein [Natribaculum luteum]